MLWTRDFRSRFVALLVASMWLAPLFASSASAMSGAAPDRATRHDVATTDGTLHLAADAQIAPQIYGSFQRFGLYDSSPLTFSAPFDQVLVRYGRSEAAATRARVDVRALDLRRQWSEWQLDVAHGSTVHFDRPMRSAQYRVVLLSNSAASPTISDVVIEPQSERLTTMAINAGSAVAPTYRLRVTRQGMVGGRTANGHVIRPNDFFVSLPSARALSSRGGNEYQVRLSANGRSVVVPVWDSGPWNHHDDYWNQKRERYRDLPVGWPQDHAAYFEKYNKGRAEEGRVRFPSAVDIADGAYWALGLDGAQATVDVTFLWLGEDPGPNPQPLNRRPSERPAARQIALPEAPSAPAPPPEPTPPPPPPEPPTIINDTDPAFFGQGGHWASVAGDCTNGGQARWVPSVDADDRATDQGVWRPALRGGTYEVYAFVPGCRIDAKTAKTVQYIVHHANGDAFIPVDQAAAAGTWKLIGRFSFAPGSDGYVQLRNVAADDDRAIWFDAVKWVPVAP